MTVIGAILQLFLVFLIHSSSSQAVASDAPPAQSVGKIRSAADLAFSKGESEEAAKLWKQVIALEPQNEQNYYKLFRVHLRQKKHRDAVHDLSECLKLKPNHVQALSQRAKLLLKVGRCAESEVDFTNLSK